MDLLILSIYYENNMSLLIFTVYLISVLGILPTIIIALLK